MEFPDLGQHCSNRACSKLDFLPFKCDGCKKFYCSEHFTFKDHNCTSGRKDHQVPTCPLCNQPIPTPPNASPDETVSRHIDQFCPSERRKIYTNRCSHKNCKKKELVPVRCNDCKLNFCLKHRNAMDHECQGSRIARERAAERRNQQQNNLVSQIQGGMSEEEALNLAIQLSMQDKPAEAPSGSKDICALA